MQQLEQLRKELINHPLRKIEITYKNNTDFSTTQDEDFLAVYIRLHDYEFEMQNIATALFHKFSITDKNLKTLSVDLAELNVALEECCLLADKLSEISYVFEETSLEKVTNLQLETGGRILEYNNQIMDVHVTLKELGKLVNEYHHRDNDESSSLYGEFSRLQTLHYRNNEKNKIDIPAFKKEFERFRGVATIQEKQRRHMLEFCATSMNNYTILNYQTASLYNVWKEFTKRCNLLRRMSELHLSTVAFNNN